MSQQNVRVESKPRFRLICDIKYGYNDDYAIDEVNVRIDWGVQSKTPLKNFLTELLKKVACQCLLIHQILVVRCCLLQSLMVIPR